jgi:hypothetical protein
MRTSLTTLALVLAALLLGSPLLFAQTKDKSQEANVRSVQGTVSDDTGKPIDGAVVHLKNVKTLQIRSFITKSGGSYSFHGLSTNVDFELRAEYQGASSDVRTLSVFDPRSKAIINLKLNKK